jgi:hypothetical protein
MKTRNLQVIDLGDWDDLVEKTYGRPYSFQQQDGCKERQVFEFDVPSAAEDYDNTTVPEVVNHNDMGVSFAAWLARDPKAPLGGPDGRDDFGLGLWWGRNFYPDVQMVANDLHAKGLLEAGHYGIDIDW